LAQVDSKLYGVAVVSTDGQMVTAGDVNHPFSIQSISKVYSLALAMEEMGPEKVFKTGTCYLCGLKVCSTRTRFRHMIKFAFSSWVEFNERKVEFVPSHGLHRNALGLGVRTMV
jgi:hypothetical protein